MNWEIRSREDLARAEQARAEGNHGLSRVCARRAVAWAAKAYIQESSLVPVKTSGFENLIQLVELGIAQNGYAQAIQRLTSNLEHENEAGEEIWPTDLDLIADARMLIDWLFPHNELSTQ